MAGGGDGSSEEFVEDDSACGEEEEEDGDSSASFESEDDEVRMPTTRYFFCGCVKSPRCTGCRPPLRIKESTVRRVYTFSSS